MKGKRTVAFLALLMAFLLSVTAVSAEGSVSYEWSDTVWEWVFVQDGEILTNQWVEYEGERYYAGEDGSRYENGAFQIGDAWYVFDGNGVLQNDGLYDRYNYETDEIEYYYAQADGKLLLNDWKQDDEKWYYFGADGKAYTNGVYEIGGAWYGFTDQGWMYRDQTFSVDRYDQEADMWVTVGSYRAKEDGTLYVNAWYYEDYGNGPDYEWSDWYYYGDKGKAVKGFATVQGKQYYFRNDGCMYTEGVYTEDEESALRFFVVDADGIAKEAFNNQWTALGGYWYYVQDNAFCSGEIYTIGGKQYGFDYDAKMYYDAVFERYNEAIDDWEYYYAQGGAADGALAQSKWILTPEGYWTYYGADAKRYQNGVYAIYDVLYGFDASGWMYDDESFSFGHWDEEIWEWVNDGHYRARAGGALYVNAWYYEDYGNGPDYEWGDWYYYGADGKAPQGLVTVDGKQYYFSGDGYILTGGTHTVYEGDTVRCILVNASGVAREVLNNRWTLEDGYWYYVQDNAFCYEGIYEIGGKLYGFDWDCRMYFNTDFSIYDEETGEWEYYYAQGGAADGALAQNQWVKLYDYGAWYYFGDDGLRYEGGIYQIGGKRYAFSNNGELRTDEIVEDYATGKYYYATYMDENGNGGSIATYVGQWKAINGEWVYFTGDSSLYVGWLENNKYYMQPEMTYATYFLGDDGYAYVAAGNGVSQKLTSTGFIELYGRTIYLENGKPATEKWIQSGGKWYYFDEGSTMLTNCSAYIGNAYYFFDANGVMACNGWVADSRGRWYFAQASGALITNKWRGEGARWYYFLHDGMMVYDGSYYIDNAFYFFDADGVMANKGWIKDSHNHWFWAASSGKLFTGVDSAGYVFQENGVLVENGTCEVNGVWYVTNGDGKKVGSFSTAGWHQAGGSWYYVDDYGYGKELVRWEFVDEKDRFFVFDNDGKMLANQFYDNRYLGGNGDALTGWFKVDGIWYYGNPNDCGWLHRDGIYSVNGKAYLFADDGRLLVNTTVYDYYSEQIVTTNNDGAVIKRTAPNGWTYRQSGGYGEALYFVNGKPYTGWTGDYYIREGAMAVNEFIETDNGKLYYVNKKGVKVKSGWYEIVEDYWVYARADGSLVCNDWLQQGSKWYYFRGDMMAYDETLTINGKQHSFDKNGVWLGENRLGTTDGWKSFNGNWYYIMAERTVRDRELLIDGKWYYFDYDGKMVTDCFAYTEGGCFYYTAGGERADYLGWKKIHGEWVYFDRTHKLSSWVFENGKRYYVDVYGDALGMYIGATVEPHMVTGYCVIGSTMYYFDNAGVLVRTVNQQGWLKVGNDWYYIDEYGQVVSGETEYKIGNAYYAFDYDGKMIANDVMFAWYDNSYSYYDAGGKLVTKQGWYTAANGKWVYVLANGKIAENGVFKIGGKEYYFNEGYWVE